MLDAAYAGDESVIRCEVIALKDGDQSHERTRVGIESLPEDNFGEVLRIDLILAAIQFQECLPVLPVVFDSLGILQAHRVIWVTLRKHLRIFSSDELHRAHMKCNIRIVA